MATGFDIKRPGLSDLRINVKILLGIEIDNERELFAVAGM